MGYTGRRTDTDRQQGDHISVLIKKWDTQADGQIQTDSKVIT
jgi:hypothetical protein